MNATWRTHLLLLQFLQSNLQRIRLIRPRIFFQIVVPIMKPSIVSVAILEAMWIWNDYLLPYLTLDLGKYKTISVAVQYLKGGYGSVDMGAMMACLVMAIIPIIIFYLICQKYIVKGVMAGAVKG